MLFRKTWKHKKTCTDGSCKIFGVNIFDHKWTDTGERVTVTDPLYHQEYEFCVFTVEIKGKTKKFVAGEFSNCVYGFYL